VTPESLARNPYVIIAMRTMTREPLVRDAKGWSPGYPCPAGDRGFIPHHPATVDWMASRNLCAINGDEARLTDFGRYMLDLLDGVEMAA
jgi:hypothetical protein